MDYEKLCRETVKIAKETGKYILSERGKISFQQVESKGKHNYVTEVDKNSEKKIIERLKKVLPDAGFIAEEGTNEEKGKVFNWIIDPLDGTTNFIHGAPPVAVSVALMENDSVVVGVVYEIFHDECFYAWKGSPAFLNDKKIKVSETPEVKDSLIATGFPYFSYDRMRGFMDSLEYFFTNTHGVRRLGSAATDLAYVACGRYDAFYEYNLNPWDVAAGSFIIEQAGGKNADFKGGNNYIFGKEIVSSNNKTFKEFLKDVSNFMNK